jgi:hypothetical protein
LVSGFHLSIPRLEKMAIPLAGDGSGSLGHRLQAGKRDLRVNS